MGFQYSRHMIAPQVMSCIQTLEFKPSDRELPGISILAHELLFPLITMIFTGNRSNKKAGRI